jgi:hypothetical protein
MAALMDWQEMQENGQWDAWVQQVRHARNHA